MTLERVVVGAALLGLAATAAAVRGPIRDAVSGPGGTAPQRALAGGTAGVNPRLARPLRVVVLDGLPRAHVPRVGALAALCDRGAALTVDVGYPTKSLAVQRALWSGMTAQQTGDAYGNVLTAAPPSSLPLLVPGMAVVESHAVIARSVGFGAVLPAAESDANDPLAVPELVRAWKEGEFVTAARDAVASEWPLVMVHVLAIDEAAHRGGLAGPDYDDAIAAADAVLGAVVTAAPDAQWLVLSDHGHLPGGGHGDAEDEIRRVTACWDPAPDGVRAGEVHLVDVARWLADSAGAPRDPHAVGRALAVAVAHPDPEATLPRPSWLAKLAAILLLAGGIAATWRWRVHDRPGVAALAAAWPVVTGATVLAIHGVPSLSAQVPTWLVAIATAVPCAAALASTWTTPNSGARVAIALLSVTIAIVIGVGILSGVAPALTRGPPARMPYWTAVFGAGAVMLAVACATTGAFLVGNGAIRAVRRVRSTGRARPEHGH